MQESDHVAFSKLMLLANHIGTPFRPNPNFVHLFGVDVPSLSYSERLLFSIGIIRVSHSQRSVENEVCCLAAVLVWWIVCITFIDQSKTDIDGCKYSRSVYPCENVIETP